MGSRSLSGCSESPGWRPQVVLVSSHDQSDLGDAIGASGARGFIPKSELSTEAIDSLVS